MLCCALAAGRNKIIIVGMSGLRHDYVDQPNLPTFRKFILEGVRAKQLDIPFVTNSAPSLATIVTGLWPEEHGVIDDSMTDPNMIGSYKFGLNKLTSDWLPVKPIWITAEEAGIKTAVSGWLGSDIKFGSVNASLFHKFVPRESEEDSKARIAEFTSWMYGKADLGLILLPQPDNSGHEHGAESDEVKSAMVRNDGLLKYLLDNLQALDGLDQRTNIIILGDHGMADHSSNHVVYLSDLGITLGDLKWVTGNMFTTGMMIPHNGLVNSVYQKLTSPKGKIHLTSYLKKDIPEKFHLKYHRRTPPILVIPEVGYRVEITRPHSDIRFPTRQLGMHGYDNSVADMKPAMLALGPDFKKQKSMNTFHANEIYPLVCSMLQLKNCHGSDGTMDNPQEIVTVTLKDQRKAKKNYRYLNTGPVNKYRSSNFGSSGAMSSLTKSNFSLYVILSYVISYLSY
ncbi:ENPP5 [Bugula neritina]|uniref:ENPP5 n=1 Tax=Bugula neritina TaxID=10212 RepID=A0A7J7JNP4_BUGNE|nr:ENPP5 [Bugula neritina]